MASMGFRGMRSAKFLMSAQLPRVFVLYVHMFSLGNPSRVVFYIVGCHQRIWPVLMALRVHRRMSALQKSVFPRGVDVQSVDVHQHPVLDMQLAGRMLRRFVI